MTIKMVLWLLLQNKLLVKLYFVFLFLCLSFMMIKHAFDSSHQFYRNYHIRFMHTIKPTDVDIHYFDNGMCGFWWNAHQTDIQSCILVFSGHLCDFYSHFTNYFALQKLFPHYQIIYLENPLSSQHTHRTSIFKLSEWVTLYLEVIDNLFRFCSWKEIGLIGMDSGCSLMFSIFKHFHPQWIFAMNTSKYLNSYFSHQTPLTIIDYLKSDISLQHVPMLIVHTRHNPKLSFLESYSLFKAFQTNHFQCHWTLVHGIYDECFLSIENRRILQREINFLIHH